jgi:hypothetical protein
MMINFDPPLRRTRVFLQYGLVPDRLRAVGISRLLELMQLVFGRALNEGARVDCVSQETRPAVWTRKPGLYEPLLPQPVKPRLKQSFPRSINFIHQLPPDQCVKKAETQGDSDCCEWVIPDRRLQAFLRAFDLLAGDGRDRRRQFLKL